MYYPGPQPGVLRKDPVSNIPAFDTKPSSELSVLCVWGGWGWGGGSCVASSYGSVVPRGLNDQLNFVFSAFYLVVLHAHRLLSTTNNRCNIYGSYL